MINLTFITTVSTIALTVLYVRERFKYSEVKAELLAETKLRKGHEVQLETSARRERDLEKMVSRVRWEGEQDLKNQHDTLGNLREDLRASRKLVKEKQKVIDEYVFSDITSIKFTAHVPDAGWKRTEFKLGIGSCGKEVTALHWTEKDDRYELTQTCTDGERKEFIYYKKDVAGRIETAYKVANTTH